MEWSLQATGTSLNTVCVTICFETAVCATAMLRTLCNTSCEQLQPAAQRLCLTLHDIQPSSAVAKRATASFSVITCKCLRALMPSYRCTQTHTHVVLIILSICYHYYYTTVDSSGICDGAGSILVASESALTENDLKPLARVVAWAVVGCEPSIMGIGALLLLYIHTYIHTYICVCIFISCR
jgi:hypothetical protein